MGRKYRYNALVEMAASLGLIVLKRGNVTTFRRPGYRQQIDNSANIDGNESGFATWRFLESLNTNIATETVSEVPGVQDGQYQRRLLEFTPNLKPELVALNRVNATNYIRSAKLIVYYRPR